MTTSDRQLGILTVMREWIEEHGYPPTVREIGAAVGLAPSSVDHHLKALKRQGLLRRDAHGPRAVDIRRVVPDTAVNVPLVGAIAAGRPIFAQEEVEDELPLPSTLVGHGTLFALRVKGESMIDDGILDGDFIFVKKSLTAERGDIVVALIDDEATVKRYYPEGDVIRFQPANATMQPILVRRRDFKSVNLIGIVVGVYRKIR